MRHLLALVLVTGTLAPAWGQSPPAAGAASKPIKPFAPGVLTTIDPAPQPEEMFSGPAPLVEIPVAIPDLAYDPMLNPKSATIAERAKTVTLRRAIWNLEFSFKPMRMIEVDIPQPNGRLQRKLVWYLCYRVRNLGKATHIKPKETTEEVARTVLPSLTHTTYKEFEATDEVEVMGRKGTELRFFPHFVLKSTEYGVEYLDRVLPAALEPIRQREFPGRQDVELYNSLTISQVPIGISEPDNNVDKGVWGVVTWVDVDPRIDYYIIYVQGLTNAYKAEDAAGAFTKDSPPGTGRKILKKTLQLNFWRPGDTIDPSEEEIRYGCRIDPDPAEQQKIYKEFGIDKPIDYQWVYR
jgi:hypothetical protein